MTHLIAGIAVRRREVHQVEEEGGRKGALEVSAQTLEGGGGKEKRKRSGEYVFPSRIKASLKTCVSFFSHDSSPNLLVCTHVHEEKRGRVSKCEVREIVAGKRGGEESVPVWQRAGRKNWH